MPLLHIHSLGSERAWGQWHIGESEQELSFIALESCPDEIQHPQKRLEWLAARALTRGILESFGLIYHGVRKDDFGKPYLKEHSHEISLSHSYPYVVAQIDKTQSVGIDLEQPKEKLRTIANRVFNESECKDAGDDLTKLCIYWSAKEALYKIYGKRNLLFSDHLIVSPFVVSGNGHLTGQISFAGHKTIVELEYIVKEDFVIVFTSV